MKEERNKNSSLDESDKSIVYKSYIIHKRDILECTASNVHPVLKEVNQLSPEGSITVGGIMNVLLWKIVKCSVLYIILLSRNSYMAVKKYCW